MRTCIFISIILVLFSSCGKQGNNLVWSDEFNYTGLPDTTKWGNEVGSIRNHELQYYTYRRIENSVVKNGNLMLIGIREPWEGFDYTSASINSLGKFSTRYGKVEARMKLPVGQGIWPAFWMMGTNIAQVGWPRCGEIDIMEHINSNPLLYGTAHWYNEKHISSGGTIPCDVSQYHVYAVERSTDSIRWLVDNNRYFAIGIKDGENSTQEFHEPFYIMLNLAIGGDWPKDPDSTSVFPDTVFVDYVRVYKELPK